VTTTGTFTDHLEPWRTWYLIVTNPRAEAATNARLRQAGHETLYLHYNGQISHAGKQTAKILPYFPRYLFVALAPLQGLYSVSKTIGVHSVVGVNEPEEVPIGVIEELRARGDSTGFCVLNEEEKKVRKRLQRDARIRYSPDPFTEYFGEVMLDAGSAISVWINGRKVVAPHHQISPVGAAREG